MEPLVKATVIDGVAATEDRDSQGEILKLAGADISQMTTKGYFNDNHGTGFLNTLGRITEAKKIFKQEDCDTDRQKLFWEQKKRPFLYVKGYLFDDADHPNAKAVGAIMKEFQKMGTPLDVKYSVEGKVLDRASWDRSILAQSMVRNVALTLVPANGETAAAVAGRINKSAELIKSEAGKAVATCVERLAKSIEEGVQPINRWDLPTDEEIAEDLLKRVIELTNLIKTKRQARVQKMMSPGYGGSGAPGQLTGGAATVAKERRRREGLKEVIKSTLALNPGVSLVNALEMVLTEFRKRFG